MAHIDLIIDVICICIITIWTPNCELRLLWQTGCTQTACLLLVGSFSVSFSRSPSNPLDAVTILLIYTPPKRFLIRAKHCRDVHFETDHRVYLYVCTIV